MRVVVLTLAAIQVRPYAGKGLTIKAVDQLREKTLASGIEELRDG